jgi:hypothetical protein
MIFALFVIASLVTVLTLASKLHETRYQLDQERRRRAVYERQMFESLVVARVISSKTDREVDQ